MSVEQTGVNLNTPTSLIECDEGTTSCLIAQTKLRFYPIQRKDLMKPQMREPTDAFFGAIEESKKQAQEFAKGVK